jgi:hypothetical protein
MKYDFDQIIDRSGTNSIKWEPEVLNNFSVRRYYRSGLMTWILSVPN